MPTDGLLSKLPFVGFLVTVVLVQVCLAAITVDTSGIGADGMSGTSETISLTVASHSDMFLVGGYGVDTNSFASSFTFNGDALTEQTGASIQQGSFTTAGIWTRVAPDVATGNLVVNFGSSIEAAVCGLSLYGVDQSTSIRDSDETSGTSTSGTLTLTTVAGDIVFYVVYVAAAGGDPTALDHTAGSATGETEIGEAVPGGAADRVGCAYATAAGSSTQIGYSWSNSNKFALVAVSVAPAAAAAATSAVPIFRRRK